jgi:hypothetical protein
MSNLQYRFLEQELAFYKTTLSEAADMVLTADISKYPIFVAHQGEVELGILLIDREKTAGNWTIHVSTLEEFVMKQVIQPEKIDEFKKVYKDARGQLCFFVLSELGATFNFLPR